MKSDIVKRLALRISVVIATVLFFCLYLINLGANNSDTSSQATEAEAVSDASINNIELKEKKSIYSLYRPDDFMGVYINVFSTKDEKGVVYDFSDLDLMADWNKDLNPLLDANVQFVERERQAKGQNLSSPNATIRVRGNVGASLKSYRISFMDGTEGFNGQLKYNLDKNLNDPSRIANKLAHDLIIDVDHIASFRTSFLEAYIRDDSANTGDTDYISYGLYTHIEQPNKNYLKSHGLDENGSLYRAEDFSYQLTSQIRNVDDPDYNETSFESVLAIREGKDHTRLIRMLSDINDDTKDFDEVFNTYFNEDNYLTWLSINILLGNTDAMTKDFLLYNPSNSAVFYLLPWKFDSIFKWMEEDSALPNIYDGLNNVVLHRKYLQQDGNIEKLNKRIKELNKSEFSSDKVKALIKLYKPILMEMMDKYPDNVLLSLSFNEQIAYLKQIDERILMNYNEFMKRYD